MSTTKRHRLVGQTDYPDPNLKRVPLIRVGDIYAGLVRKRRPKPPIEVKEGTAISKAGPSSSHSESLSEFEADQSTQTQAGAGPSTRCPADPHTIDSSCLPTSSHDSESDSELSWIILVGVFTFIGVCFREHTQDENPHRFKFFIIPEETKGSPWRAIVLVKIGQIGRSTLETFHQVVFPITTTPRILLPPDQPEEPPDEVGGDPWFKKTIERLNKAEIISCTDVNALEQELIKLVQEEDSIKVVGL